MLGPRGLSDSKSSKFGKSCFGVRNSKSFVPIVRLSRKVTVPGVASSVRDRPGGRSLTPLGRTRGPPLYGPGEDRSRDPLDPIGVDAGDVIPKRHVGYPHSPTCAAGHRSLSPAHDLSGAGVDIYPRAFCVASSYGPLTRSWLTWILLTWLIRCSEEMPAANLLR